MVWNVATSDFLTFKYAYNNQVSRQNNVSLGKLIWSPIISHEKFLLLCRFTQNVIATYDILTKMSSLGF